MANPDKDVEKAEQQPQDQREQLNEASPNPGNVRENDSMFNNADPQTAAILEQETKERNEAAKRNSPKDRKSA